MFGVFMHMCGFHAGKHTYAAENIDSITVPTEK